MKFPDKQTDVKAVASVEACGGTAWPGCCHRFADERRRTAAYVPFREAALVVEGRGWVVRLAATETRVDCGDGRAHQSDGTANRSHRQQPVTTAHLKTPLTEMVGLRCRSVPGAPGSAMTRPTPFLDSRSFNMTSFYFNSQ